MRKALTLRTLSAALMIAASPALAQDQPPVSESAAPKPAGTLVDVAVGNAAFSTLVTAVKAADLVAVLSEPGPFTLFAPTNDAFAKLPAGTVETLVKPESKDALTAILTYHVVPGKMRAADLVAQIRAGGGAATLATLAGGNLTATIDGETVVLTDAKGGKSRVVATDGKASNGVVHAIDTLVMP